MAAPSRTEKSSGRNVKTNSTIEKPPSKVHLYAGKMITCDATLKQFLMQLNHAQPQELQFVIRDLDDRHLFIHRQRFPAGYATVEQWLQYEVQQWNRQWTFQQQCEREDH
mmetsp:Transcript_4186/g.7087  ORF Transcript_4186/g.7087 Transcript_4186/m.7087 type:complete len:110 (-) Transcript_4186:113-442(-)